MSEVSGKISRTGRTLNLDCQCLSEIGPHLFPLRQGVEKRRPMCPGMVDVTARNRSDGSDAYLALIAQVMTMACSAAIDSVLPP